MARARTDRTATWTGDDFGRSCDRRVVWEEARMGIDDDKVCDVAMLCCCSVVFIGIGTWRYTALVAAANDVEWTEGQCEITEGTVREIDGDNHRYLVSFKTHFYHNRTDIENPISAMSNEWGDPDWGSEYSSWGNSSDWQTNERNAETYRRSVIDCCGEPGNGAVWGYNDGPACNATPKCSTESLNQVEHLLFLDSAWQGVHTFGCALCFECCSAMAYEVDASSYTGYSTVGAYKRQTCYARTEDFDEYVNTPEAERKSLLWLRLHPEESYDVGNDPTVSGKGGPILCFIVGILLCCCAAAATLEARGWGWGQRRVPSAP